jgi:hypothetical protein
MSIPALSDIVRNSTSAFGSSSSASGAVGTATISFGADPGSDVGSVVVTGQSGISSTSHVEAWIMGDTTATNTADDHELAQVLVRLVTRNVVADTGFTIIAYVQGGQISGDLKVHWVWN